MKYCIVNGDDFGASHGIVRGILEAHERGILTSTSLMVDMPASEAAAAAARSRPRLGVGLHFDLGRPPAGGPLAAVRSEFSFSTRFGLEINGRPNATRSPRSASKSAAARVAS